MLSAWEEHGFLRPLCYDVGGDRWFSSFRCLEIKVVLILELALMKGALFMSGAVGLPRLENWSSSLALGVGTIPPI